MRRLIAAALLACGCAHAPESQPPAAPAPTPQAAPAPEKLPPLAPAANDRENQADWAISLFMQSCIANLTKPADLTRWIQEHDLGKVPAELESRILAGQPGEVWSAGNALGIFLLIVVPIDPRVNQCSVWAQHADAARLNAHFTRLLAGTARPGLLVEEVSDGPIKGPGGEYRQLVYYVHKEGVALGFVFVATTSPSEEAEVQGRLMASPGEGRKIVLPGGLPPDEPEKNEPDKER